MSNGESRPLLSGGAGARLPKYGTRKGREEHNIADLEVGSETEGGVAVAVAGDDIEMPPNPNPTIAAVPLLTVWEKVKRWAEKVCFLLCTILLTLITVGVTVIVAKDRTKDPSGQSPAAGLLILYLLLFVYVRVTTTVWQRTDEEWVRYFRPVPPEWVDTRVEAPEIRWEPAYPRDPAGRDPDPGHVTGTDPLVAWRSR